MYNCYLTCPRGLEKLANDEISTYSENIIIGNGGINFTVDKLGLYSINLKSRIGMHLLVELFTFNADNDNSLYTEIRKFNWHNYIDVNQTFIIKMRGNSDIFQNKNYATLKIKDAVVDQIKKIKLARPSIDKNNPDIIISIFISNDHFKVYIDSSGISLHKRGYRNKIHKAALNESLAAGLVMLSNWNKIDPFYDTMCGSGTIAIEAALIAHNIAPGLFRKEFSFQKWQDYDESLYNKVKSEQENQISINEKVEIFGYDSEFANIAMALYSIKLLNLEKYISLKKQSMEQFNPKYQGATLIINPPYGERLGEEDSVNDLYKMIGDVFKKQCVDFKCFVFTANLDAAKHIGLKASQKIVLKNGNLDSRFLSYPIQKGTYNKKSST